MRPNHRTFSSGAVRGLAALGLEYAVDDSLKLRGGIPIDQSPIPDGTITPRIPDAVIAVGICQCNLLILTSRASAQRQLSSL